MGDRERELIQALNILDDASGGLTEDELRQRRTEHILRLHRLSKIIDNFPPESLKALDIWLGRQELGDRGYVLVASTGWDESDTHYIAPEAAVCQQDLLSDNVLSALGLDRRRLRKSRQAKSA